MTDLKDYLDKMEKEFENFSGSTGMNSGEVTGGAITSTLIMERIELSCQKCKTKTYCQLPRGFRGLKCVKCNSKPKYKIL